MFEKIIDSFFGNYFEFSLYFLVASLFFGNAPLSIAYVIFLVASIPKVYENFKIRDFLVCPSYVIPCAFFSVNFMILLFLAENFSELIRIEKLLPFLLFPIIFFSVKERIRCVKVRMNFLQIFIFSALLSFILSFVYGLYRVFFAESNINFIYITYNHLASLFNVQPIYLSLFYLIAILVSLDLYKKKISPRRMVFFSIILFLGIVLLSSRTALALSIIAIIIKFIEMKAFTKMQSVILVVFFISCAALTFSLPVLRNRIVNFDENVSSYSGVSFRLKIWQNVWEVGQTSPLYGNGFHKSQERLLEQYKKVNFRRAYIFNYNAHNQYLQTYLDSGILGFALLIIMLLIPFWKLKTNIITYSLFFLIMIMAIIPESFFSRQYGVIFFSLFSLFFLTINRIDIDKDKS